MWTQISLFPDQRDDDDLLASKICFIPIVNNKGDDSIALCVFVSSLFQFPVISQSAVLVQRNLT